MKEQIKGVLDWHEDSTGVIGNEKFDRVIDDMFDLYKMGIYEIFKKMHDAYPEQYCRVILEEYYKLMEEDEKAKDI